jgi:cell division protein FtsI/penicillin-binding protein 2
MVAASSLRSNVRGLRAAATLLALASALGGGAAWADPQVDLDTLAQRGDHLVAGLHGGGLAELTLMPALQDAALEVLDTYRIPFGAAVAISVPDGRVLALAARSAVDPSLGPDELVLRPWAPAASVFKVVAASALLADAHLTPSTRVCYHGGLSAVLPDNLVDIPLLDRRCDSLAYGIGKSQNAIIAKLAARHLAPENLRSMATAFGFGAPIAFDAPVEASACDVPAEPLEFARAAAGFWHSSLSPLHGALLAATVASDGQMPAPRLIERAFDAQGRALAVPVRPARRVLDPAVAQEMRQMMALTTRMGTARTGFHDRRGRPYLPIEVAGKTGSLSYRGQPSDPPLPAADLGDGDTHLAYSWFVGFAPADRPRIAFAVVIGNRSVWRIKATFVARRLVAEYLAVTAPKLATAPAKTSATTPARTLATAPDRTPAAAKVVAGNPENTPIKAVATDGRPAKIVAAR